VRVRGDFFLDPPEALGAIDAALEGAPADLPAVDLTARVRAALRADAEMLGCSPEAVAEAVRRGLARP
jgi:lipoate-protein ligase A